MKTSEVIMEILEAFDLTKSYYSAGKLAGVDPKTVKHYVERRAVGLFDIESIYKPKLIDPHGALIEQLVELSKGKIRADVVHDRLVATKTYQGSERTTRRAVALAKEAYFKGHRRIYRPWVPEPGMWFQFDWGDGPMVAGEQTSLWCAWLAWSRFRVIIPTRDCTLPTVIACFDETLREFGGAPTYALTDNERTITTDRVAMIPVRHPLIVATGRHYGTQIQTCYTGDPESKGGVEATVKIAKADLVPTDANLLPEYKDFDQLRAACKDFMHEVNTRPHRETRRPPIEMLAEERVRLHSIPDDPYTAAFGETRIVDSDSTIRFHSCRYSVPHTLVGERVWASARTDELVVVHVSAGRASEVARHKLTTPGNPRIDPSHYPERDSDPLNPKPKAVTIDEKQFLAIGAGAKSWLIEAAATGVQRVRVKMQRAIELASLVGNDLVDRALGIAATAGRFDEGDLESITEHLRIGDQAVVFAAAFDDANTQLGTGAWERAGR